MAIPELNVHGVLPVGQYDCSAAEIAVRYSYNHTRTAIWGGFERFIQWASTQPQPSKILVDGSFTSDKDHPRDVDIVFDLDGCALDCQQHWFTVFVQQRVAIKATYSVDFWIYFPGFPKDLRAFFEYLRPEEALARGMGPESRKGLLSIAP